MQKRFKNVFIKVNKFFFFFRYIIYANFRIINFTINITIMTEERISLPNYTVSLVCCGLFSLLVAAPVILHSRFQSAGVDSSGAQGVDMMPMLETEATKGAPPPT